MKKEGAYVSSFCVVMLYWAGGWLTGSVGDTAVMWLITVENA